MSPCLTEQGGGSIVRATVSRGSRASQDCSLHVPCKKPLHRPSYRACSRLNRQKLESHESTPKIGSRPLFSEPISPLFRSLQDPSKRLWWQGLAPCSQHIPHIERSRLIFRMHYAMSLRIPQPTNLVCGHVARPCRETAPWHSASNYHSCAAQPPLALLWQWNDNFILSPRCSL